MRVAVVSDIHGNPTAFAAVLADLHHMSPDLVLHGGDLTMSGSNSALIVDQVRDLGWQGVIGNTDQMLANPQSFEDFAAPSPSLEHLWQAIREIATDAREELGEARLAWLGSLPCGISLEQLALVHASPKSPWRAPGADATDEELRSTYAPLEQGMTVYAHIHTPYVRRCAATTVINTGSVSLSYDGDPRASYLLLNDAQPTIRRVEYDVEKEVRALRKRRLPHHAWIVKTLQTATACLPE